MVAAAAPVLWRRTRSNGRTERFGHVRERARCRGLTPRSPDREVSVSITAVFSSPQRRRGRLFSRRLLAFHAPAIEGRLPHPRSQPCLT